MNPKNAYSVRLRVTDHGGLTKEQAFVVHVADVNESPVLDMRPSTPAKEKTASVSIDGERTAGSSVWRASAADPDAGDSLTYTITSGNEEGLFSIDATGRVKLARDAQQAASASYALGLRVTDSDGLYDGGSLTVAINTSIHLTERTLVGWEGDKLGIYLKADAANQSIGQFEIDVNNDGAYDYSTAAAGDGSVLAFDLDLLHLLGNPADDGDYPAEVKVTTASGGNAVFSVEITVGNVPPNIEFAENAVLGALGVPFALPITTSDPGPDTVTQIVIDWGDGTSSTLPGGSGTPTHLYAAEGHYTIRATTTDEDGTTWAEHEIDIGIDNPPPIDDGSPIILSAVATILTNGNALLTVEAENSAGGNADLTYEWDLDGDGVFETSAGATIEVPATANPVRYVAWIRISDGAGRAVEALLAFTEAGEIEPDESAGTENTYRQNFKNATPAMSDSEWGAWKIHHTKQQRLRARYAQAGVNVDNIQHHRAVPIAVHDKFITPQQNKWWQKWVDNGRFETLNLAYENMPLSEVEDFEKELEKDFAKYWIKAGASKSAINTTANAAKKDIAKLAAGTADRWKRLGIITGALGVFSFLSSMAPAISNAKDFDPDTHLKFGIFMDNYNSCLGTAINGQRPDETAMSHLIDAMFDFAEDIDEQNNLDTLERLRFGAQRILEAGYRNGKF